MKAYDGRTVRLEAYRAGHRWLSSEAALTRFIAALTPPAEPSTPAVPSPAERRRAAARADEELTRRLA